MITPPRRLEKRNSMENEQLKLIDVIEEMWTQKDVPLEPMRVARDIMNADVKTLTLDHTVIQCIKFMESYKVLHVPVVDLPYKGEKKPYFVGVVSQRDVLRLNVPDDEETGIHKQEIDRRALRQLLVQIVARKPHSVSLQTPIQDVIAAIIRYHIDMLPVLDKGDLVGIITITELIKLLFRLDKAVKQLYRELKDAAMASNNSAKAEVLFSWISRTVQEIMTEQPICLDAKDNIATAIEVIQTKEIRHILIIDEQKTFVGLVSDRNILRSLPFAGRRPPRPPKKFREHLFASTPHAKIPELPLESIMIPKPKVLHVPPGFSVFDAADIVNKKIISCLPVIDEQEKLRGIVTTTDLMRALLTAYEPAEKDELILSQSSSR
jgi:CBS domain-containing membrane protein